MKGPPYQGNYYGRSMLQTENVTSTAGVWRCVEVRVTLNSAGGSHDGDLAVWLDDQLVQHFRPGSPLGSWDAVGNWVTAATGQPFEGFRWRDSTDLGLNFVRVLNYDSPHDVWVDDLVVSRERIGCDAGGGGGGGPLCGNGVVDAGEACDDGNAVDADGCGTGCEIDHGAQTPFQRRCIDRVNQGIAHVARTRARANERCLARAESSVDFDGCLEEDRAGRLERAAQSLEKVERRSCLPDQLPELALGSDRLAEAAAAKELPSELARDVFGRPAVAAPKEDRQAKRCQSAVLKHAHALLDTLSGEARAALAEKLEGRRTAPAVNEEELSRFVAEALEESPRIAKVAASLRKRVARACADAPDLTALFPGCASADVEQVSACAERAARCRACELLGAANERLDVNCDLLDDQTEDLSCGSAP
jgi:cysteine-rich repeat protein